jgi:hypothetical protein
MAKHINFVLILGGDTDAIAEPKENPMLAFDAGHYPERF